MSAWPYDLVFLLLVVMTLLTVLLVIIYPIFSGEAQAEKRHARLVKGSGHKFAVARLFGPAQKRRHVAESIQEIDESKKKTRRLTLERQIVYSGLQISKVQFFMWSTIAGLVIGLAMFIYTGEPLTIIPGYLVGGFVVPFLILHWLRRRRVAKFLEHFSSALDVIVRGVRAGLPLAQCMSIVARELPDPVATEFRLLHESLSVGFTITEAVERMADRLPTPEARFFSILIAIQQGSGGSLSESLTNLSSVLRDRKKMYQKVRAMSAEAKTSAAIIGSLPFGISGAITFISPDYMDTLLNTSQGNWILGSCAIWMVIGIVVMKRMITFDM